MFDEAEILTSEMHESTLERPVPENGKIQRNTFKKGVRCGAGQIPSEG